MSYIFLIDQSDTFHTPNLPHEITVMIINTGQMCTVKYSDTQRMCDLNCPNWKLGRTTKKKNDSEKI